MEIYDENISYWTDRTRGYSKVNEEELNTEQKMKWITVLKEYFPKDKGDLAILDVGTGPGFFAIILAQQGYSVTAVDCTESMLHEAKINSGEYRNQICWVMSDAHDLPFESGSFDVVVSRNLTWNLEKPEKAYSEWLRVLKKDGVLINFDANWYNYLHDDKKKRAYEEDRQNVRQLQLEDHYLSTDINRMESIALRLPLSYYIRPYWDVDVLKSIGANQVEVDVDIWNQVWSETEKVNYASTPMFSIVVKKLQD